MWGKVQSGGFWDDESVVLSDSPSWVKQDMGWNIVPWGLRKMLLYIHDRYSPKGGIFITENGCAVAEPTVDVALNDAMRVEYFRAYLTEVHKAISLGADVKGYFAWSFIGKPSARQYFLFPFLSPPRPPALGMAFSK